MTVLDNGCGTGLYLEKLAKRGINVLGYDKSPQMVDYAAARLARFECDSTVFEGDLRSFRSPTKSDMAICTNGSFQYLESADDIVSHLRCVARSLNPRGLYLVLLPSIQQIIANPPGHLNAKWQESKGDVTVEVDFTFRQKPLDWVSQTFEGSSRIAVTDGNKRIPLIMDYRYRVFTAQELRALVGASGCFEVLDFYGEYNIGRKYSKMRHPKFMHVLLRKT